MKRTTIYFEPDLEVLLKREVHRQRRPMASIVREAVHAYLAREPPQAPPGAGAFASGRRDTAERVDEILAETGFGVATSVEAPIARRRQRARPAAPKRATKAARDRRPV